MTTQQWPDMSPDEQGFEAGETSNVSADEVPVGYPDAGSSAEIPQDPGAGEDATEDFGALIDSDVIFKLECANLLKQFMDGPVFEGGQDSRAVRAVSAMFREFVTAKIYELFNGGARAAPPQKIQAPPRQLRPPAPPTPRRMQAPQAPKIASPPAPAPQKQPAKPPQQELPLVPPSETEVVVQGKRHTVIHRVAAEDEYDQVPGAKHVVSGLGPGQAARLRNGIVVFRNMNGDLHKVVYRAVTHKAPQIGGAVVPGDNSVFMQVHRATDGRERNLSVPVTDTGGPMTPGVDVNALGDISAAGAARGRPGVKLPIGNILGAMGARRS